MCRGKDLKYISLRTWHSGLVLTSDVHVRKDYTFEGVELAE